MRKYTAFVIFLITGSVYFYTRAPGLTWKFGGTDGGELATAVVSGGIAHPSGYPLYIITGKIFATLTFFEAPAGSLTLFSALTLATAMAFLYCAASALLPEMSPVAAGSVVLTFAFMQFPWSQALIVEVYSLTLMLWALILWLTAETLKNPTPAKFYFLALITGLSLGNHLILLLGLPGWGLWLLLSRPPLRWRDVFMMGMMFLIGCSIYLWLPLRAGEVPYSNWGNPDTWSRFWSHVTGEIYRVYQFKGDYTANFQHWLKSIATGFGPLVLMLPAGGWHFWQQNRPFLAGSLVSGIAIGIYRTGYAAEGVDAYWLLPDALLTLWIVAGVQRWFNLLDRRLAMVLLIFPALQLVMNFDAINLRNDRAAQNFIQDTLLPLPENAVLLLDDEAETFTLWYAVYVENQRPDVWVINVQMLQWTWYVDNLEKQYPDLNLRSDAFVSVPELMDAIPENRPVVSHFPTNFR